VRVAFGAHSRHSRLQTVNEGHYVVAEYGRHHYVLMTSLPEEEIQKRYAEYGYGMVVADGIGGDGDVGGWLPSSLRQVRWVVSSYLRQIAPETRAHAVIDGTRRSTSWLRDVVDGALPSCA
jgi:hypothetical protein